MAAVVLAVAGLAVVMWFVYLGEKHLARRRALDAIAAHQKRRDLAEHAYWEYKKLIDPTQMDNAPMQDRDAFKAAVAEALYKQGESK